MSVKRFLHNKFQTQWIPDTFLTAAIAALNKKNIWKKLLMLFMTDLILMVTDAVESKLYGEPVIRHKKKPPGNVCKVYFSNKAMELINLLKTLYCAIYKSL